MTDAPTIDAAELPPAPVPLPVNERRRLAALRALHILDTGAEQAYDDLTELAAAICDAPIALISLVDRDRQWFKSRVGIGATETPREHAFCAHTILDDRVLVVPDATLDDRFRANPLVTGHPGIRLYAGAPVRSADGHRVGTLCIIDRVPRELSSEQVRRLAVLARQVDALLELREGMRAMARANDELGRLTARAERDAEDCREIADRFERAVHATSDGLWDWDIETDEVWFSPRFRHMLGYHTESEFPSDTETFYAHLHEDDHERTREAVRQHLEKGAPFEVEYRLRHRDGTYGWFRVRGSTQRAPDGTPRIMSGSIEDISRRRHMEKALDRAQRELARSNAVLGEFSYVASHDLRSPLRNIARLGRWIQSEAWSVLPDGSKRHLSLLLERVGRMETLLDDLLEYFGAGHSRATVESVDLDALARDVVRLLTSGEDADVEVSCEVDPIETRRLPLRQCLHNLVDNAIKHHPGPARRLEISARDAGRMVEITVRDDGPGIPADAQERIFGMFQRLETDGGATGNGMGLAVVQRTIESQGGSIRVESVLGEGACFTFTWPKEPPDEAP